MTPRTLQLDRFVAHTLFDGEESASAPTDKPADVKPTDKPTAFSQEDVNKFLAEDRRIHKAKIEELSKTLDTVKGMSEKERTGLTAKVEELSNALLTKEELAKKETDKIRRKHEGEINEKTKEAEIWKNRFSDSTIVRSLTDAAVSGEAFSPAQIVKMLRENATLTELVDEAGQLTGAYGVRVKFKDVNKEGKPVMLDVSPDEAIKLMKDKTAEYGNLFKSGVITGLGTGKANQAPTALGGDLSFADYQKYRTQLRKEGKLK